MKVNIRGKKEGRKDDAGSVVVYMGNMTGVKI